MAKTDETKKAGATGTGTATATTEEAKPKVRRLNMATEEYVVGTDTDAKNKTLKGFSNLYPARNEAKAQIKAGSKTQVKIWVREIESKKLTEHVDTYEPKKESPAPAADAPKGKGKGKAGDAAPATDAGTATTGDAATTAAAANTPETAPGTPATEQKVEPVEDAA